MGFLDSFSILKEPKGPDLPPLGQNSVTGRRHQRLPTVEVVFLSANLMFYTSLWAVFTAISSERFSTQLGHGN